MDFDDLVKFILKAVCLSMGIAVIVVSALGKSSQKTVNILLGIAAACAGLALLVE